MRDEAKLQKADKAALASTHQRAVHAARQRCAAVESVADPPERDEVPVDVGVVVQERP